MINTRTHGMIDYMTGVLLIALPYIFNFATGGIEQWLPMILGFLTIGMSLLTNYELSIARIIPLRLHLGMDMMSGALLAVSPWLFGFADIIWWPHVLIGAMEIIVPMMTERPHERPAIHA
jgi:hypothetical protein